MTPRKKTYTGPAERMKASRQRRKEAGQRQIVIWLKEESIERLDSIAAAKKETRSEVIEGLISKEKSGR